MPTHPLTARNGRTNATEEHETDETDETDESAIGIEREDVPTAGRSLVVLDPDHPEASLRAAFGHLGANDRAFDLLVVYPMARFEARREELLEAGATAPYAVSDLEAEARQLAWRVGHHWLAPLGVEFEALGAVGRVHDCVRLVVAEREHARVYVEVPERTLWQRLRGVADRATALGDALSTDVSVVSVDGAAEPDADATGVIDTEVDADVAVTPDPSAER
jgi:hypothetical protein